MPIFRLTLPFLAVGLMCSLAGCGASKPSDPNDPAFVVAEGKDVSVTREELNRQLDQVFHAEGLRRDMYPPERLQPFEANFAKRLVRAKLVLNEQEGTDLSGLDDEIGQQMQTIRSNFVNELMFEQHLARAGWDSVDDFQDSLKRDLIMNRILNAKVGEVSDPTEEQIISAYEDILPSLPEREGQVRASHILVRVYPDDDKKTKQEKRKKINAARKRVQGGEDFGTVAKEISDDAYSAPKGGDLMYFPKGQWHDDFDKVAFNTKVGTVSKVFETPHGFHIVKVTDKREPGTMALAELRPQLVQYLRELEKAKRKMEYVDELVDGAEVEYFIDVSPEMSGPPSSAPAAGSGGVAGESQPVKPNTKLLPNLGPGPVQLTPEMEAEIKKQEEAKKEAEAK